MARHESHGQTVAIAMATYAVLDRIADAQMMLARRREAGTPMTISQVRKRMEHWRQEDIELYIEAARIAGVPE
jgi:hypothetical protein